ncbi:MAG: acetylornithine/succinylornithine family transaminase [Verrucomicrobiota bacterium]|jgi:acetylornithine/N-succinyldiaminopimelate aminotransferase
MSGSLSDSAAAAYAANVAHNYGSPPVTLVKGQGSYVWDAAGKRYLDFASGIAVISVGHSHPHWVKRVSEQAAKLVHVSNLYRNEPQGCLATSLSRYCGPGRVIFCNSGAEANEGLLKLARLHGVKKSGTEGACIGVVVAERAFHGRTFGGMSATPQEKIQKGFRPLLSGFTAAPLNDLAAWEKAIDAKTTAAVLIESIQGEGGVNPATPDFLRGVEKLCRERNVLFMIDEIQCGIGRTGKFFAYEHAGVKPDAIAMAKGLGGGFPIGAIWMAPPYDELFQAGSHGTTFGGGALASTAGLAVLEIIEAEQLVAKVAERSVGWHAELRQLIALRPDLVKEVRGAGYMVGVILNIDPIPVVAALRAAGMLTAPAGGVAVRLLPPLNASPAELAEAVAILRQVLGDWKAA